MSASKLAEQIAKRHGIGGLARITWGKALDEMALRVFEDTRERAAVLNCPLCKLVNDPEARFKVEPVKDGEHHINAEWGWDKPCASVAIRAMQPELGGTK